MREPSLREATNLSDPWNSPAEQAILELLFSICDQEKRSMTVRQIYNNSTYSVGHIRKSLWKLSMKEYIFTPRNSGRWFFNTDELNEQYQMKKTLSPLRKWSGPT